jgi:hypothetical protein
MAKYNSDGTIATTTVSGSSRTGLFAADGSLNIVLDDAVYKGLYHPCGALRVNSDTTTQRTYDPSGAYYLGTLLGRGGVAPYAPVDPTIIQNFFASDGSQNAVTAVINGWSGQYYNGRTYVAYQGAQFDLYLTAYNHSTSNFEGPYFVSKGNLVGDAHGYPGVLIKKYGTGIGTIHYMGGSHVNPLVYAKSSVAQDVSTMVVQTSPVASCSYPTLRETTDGKLWLFYRAGGHLSPWSYITSTDNGATWSAATIFLNYGLGTSDSAYAWVTNDSADNFHISWLWQDEDNSLGNPNAPAIGNRYNVYYMKLSSGATVKTNLAGTTLATFPPTLTSSNAECILVSTTPTWLLVQVAQVAVDSSNNPYISWNQLTNTNTGLPHTYKVGWWNGSSFSTSDITTTDHIFDEYDVECVSGSSAANVVLRAVVTKGGSTGTNGDYDATQTDRGGSLEEWTSTAGIGSWSKTATIITAPNTGDLYNSPNFVKDYQASAKVLYNEWVNNLSTYTAKVGLWGSGGAVRVPFEAETTAFLNRFSVTPSAAVQCDINAMWRILKASGLTASLDAFYLLGLMDAQSARLNWINTNFTLTPQGNTGNGPTHTSGAGFTGNGTDSYHDTGILAGGLTNFTQNSAAAGIWCDVNAQGAAADFGQAYGTSDVYIRLRDASNLTFGRINQNTTLNVANTDNTYLTSVVRTGATAMALRKNLSQIASGAGASSARDNTAGHTFWIGGVNLGTPQFSSRRLGACYIGAAISAAQEKALYNMLYSWFRKRGTI